MRLVHRLHPPLDLRCVGVILLAQLLQGLADLTAAFLAMDERLTQAFRASAGTAGQPDPTSGESFAGQQALPDDVPTGNGSYTATSWISEMTPTGAFDGRSAMNSPVRVISVIAKRPSPTTGGAYAQMHQQLRVHTAPPPGHS